MPKASRVAAEEDSPSVSPQARPQKRCAAWVVLSRLSGSSQGFFPGSDPLISDEVRDDGEMLDIRTEILLKGANHYTMLRARVHASMGSQGLLIHHSGKAEPCGRGNPFTADAALMYDTFKLMQLLLGGEEDFGGGDLAVPDGGRRFFGVALLWLPVEHLPGRTMERWEDQRPGRGDGEIPPPPPRTSPGMQRPYTTAETLHSAIG